MILFISSYFAVFLITAIHWLSKKHYIFGGLILFIMIISLILSTLLLHESEKNPTKSYQIIEIEDKTSSSLSYLFTYIIPFLAFSLDSFEGIATFTIFIVITFLIYLDTNMFYINPWFIILRYNILKLKVKNASMEKHIVLFIKKSDKDALTENSIINPCQIAGNIFLFQCQKQGEKL